MLSEVSLLMLLMTGVSSTSLCLTDSCPRCLPKLDATSCPQDSIMEDNIIAGCCPACVQYLKLGETCHMSDVATLYTTRKPLPCEEGFYTSAVFHKISEHEFVPLVHKFACPMGTFCNQTSHVCELRSGENGCQKELDDYHQWLNEEDPEVKCEIMDWGPSCSANGQFESEQTKASPFYQGHSFCADPYGNPIFGKWIDSDFDYNTNTNVTCGCSRKMWELNNLLKSHSTLGWSLPPTLHCTPKGSFEKLQCDHNLCWCADQTSGKPTSTILDIGLKSLLPCYESQIHSNYLRRCENRAYGKAVTRNLLMSHGLKWEENRDENDCNYNGGFGAKLCVDTECRCVDNNGQLISNYFVNLQDVSTLNCNCARDTNENRGLGLNCVPGTGEYTETQRLFSVEFCVDTNSGFRTTGLYEIPDDGRYCNIKGCQEREQFCQASGDCDPNCKIECG